MSLPALLRMRSAAGDAAVVALLFAASAWWGSAYWRAFVQSGGQPIFYQEYFEPAVMMACGRGFVVSAGQPKPLEDFLWRRTDRFSCAQIPGAIAVGPPGNAQTGMRYLLVAVAAAWRVLGISWSGLGPLSGVMFGATIAVAYGIFRLAMPWLFAVGASIALSLSTLQLRNAPHLRDYGKTPFALALIFLIGWMVRGRFGRRSVAIGAAYGVVLGIAYGFRSDFLVYLPVFVIALFGFVEGGLLRNLPVKAAAAVAMLAVFVMTAWPILAAVITRGGCEWHVAILGFASPFDEDLRLQKTPYEPSYAYADDFVYNSVVSFAARQRPPGPEIAYCTHEYDIASRQYFFELVKTLPADVLVRAYASARGMWDLPFRWQGPPLPGWHPWLYRARARVLMLLAPAGAAAMVLAVLLMAVRSPRWAACVWLLLLYLGGYPALQSDERHYFHLEFMSWWAYGALATMALAALRGWRPENLKVSLGRAAVVAVSVALAMAVPLALLRLYQQAELRTYFQRYIDAPRVPLAETTATTTMTAAQSALVEVDVNADACGSPGLVTAVYDAANPALNFSRTFVVNDTQRGRTAGVTRVFFPAYRHFQGVKVSGPDPACAVGTFRVADVRPFPLLMAVVLAPGWEHAPLYQRFR